jgi:hypothetical protein
MQEPGIHVFKIYLAPADTDERPRSYGTVRADTQALALDKAAQLHERPAYDLLAEQETLYTWCSLDPALEHVYQQALEELSTFGQEQARYYCRRLNLYVSQDEISKVATLERVLNTLEETTGRAEVIAILRADVPKFIDQDTHNRYISLIQVD